MLQTQGVTPGNRVVPHALAAALAYAGEAVWSFLRIQRQPPLTRFDVKVIGEEVTVNDRKAREELGYRPVVTREEGLREMSAGAGAA